MIMLGKNHRSHWVCLLQIPQELNWFRIHIHSLEYTCGVSSELKASTYDKRCYFCSYLAAVLFLFSPHGPTNQVSKGNIKCCISHWY